MHNELNEMYLFTCELTRGWRALLKPTLLWCWGSGVWEADTLKRVLGSWLCMKPSPKTLGTCTKISSLLSLILILFIGLCFKTVFLSCWMLARCLAYPSGWGEGEYSPQRLSDVTNILSNTRCFKGERERIWLEITSRDVGLISTSV